MVTWNAPRPLYERALVHPSAGAGPTIPDSGPQSAEQPWHIALGPGRAAWLPGPLPSSSAPGPAKSGALVIRHATTMYRSTTWRCSQKPQGGPGRLRSFKKKRAPWTFGNGAGPPSHPYIRLSASQAGFVCSTRRATWTPPDRSTKRLGIREADARADHHHRDTGVQLERPLAMLLTMDQHADRRPGPASNTSPRHPRARPRLRHPERSRTNKPSPSSLPRAMGLRLFRSISKKNRRTPRNPSGSEHR